MIAFRLAASAGRVSAPLNRGLGAFCFSSPKPETQPPPPRLSLLRRSRQPFQGVGGLLPGGRGRLLGPGGRSREPRVGGRPPLHPSTSRGGRLLQPGHGSGTGVFCPPGPVHPPVYPEALFAPSLPACSWPQTPRRAPTPTCRAWQRAAVGAAGAAGVIWRGHGAWLFLGHK